MFIKRLHVFYIYFFCGGKFLLSVCKSIKPLPDAALCRSTPIHHTPDSYTKTRTTLFLLCTKSCIVWRKIGVWCSFYWKFIKRKSQKLLGTSRSFRLCYLKIGNLLLNRLHRGDGQGRLTNGFISLYKPIHAASFFLLPYVTLRNSPQPTGNLV